MFFVVCLWLTNKFWLHFLRGELSMAPTATIRGWPSPWSTATSANLLRRRRRPLGSPRRRLSDPGRSLPPPPRMIPDPKLGGPSPPSPASGLPDSKFLPPSRRRSPVSQEAGPAAAATTLLAGPGGISPADPPAAPAGERLIFIRLATTEWQSSILYYSPLFYC